MRMTQCPKGECIPKQTTAGLWFCGICEYSVKNPNKCKKCVYAKDSYRKLMVCAIHRKGFKERKSVFDRMGEAADKAYHLYQSGEPKKAVIENRKAIKLTERFLAVLQTNDVMYDLGNFLTGESNITRKAKK